jgi:hypothetical protein
MRRRPAAAAFLFALSAFAVVVSVLTPMLLRSTQSVALAQTLDHASWSDSHVVATATTSDLSSLDTAVEALQEVSAVLDTRGAWDRPVVGSESVLPYTWTPQGKTTAREVFLAQLLSGCANVTIVQGRCPIVSGDALLPETTAAKTGVRVGSRISLSAYASQDEVTVVGIYDDRHGGGPLLARPSALAGTGIVRPEPAIAIATPSPDDTSGVTGQWNYWSATRLRDSLPLTEIGAVRSDLQHVQPALLSDANANVGGSATTSISDLLSRVAAEQTSAAVITGAIGLQALALAWFAIAAVIGRISRSRAPEWGIGRTRGVPRVTWLVAVFVEPTVAIVAGSVAGMAVGIGLAQAAARFGLGPTAVVEPWQPAVVACGVLALLGSLVALGAASVRSARLPLTSLLHETTEPRQLSRVALVAQVSAVLLTVVVVWVVLTQQQTGVAQVGLLAPALVAVVIALVALRLAVLVVRRGTDRPTRSLAGLVVGRQLARSPSVLTSAVLVAVGVALTAYSLQVSLVSDRLSVAQADAASGAPTVLEVSVPAGSDLVADVDRADPGGRTAMAAAEADGANFQSTNRIVAVDASRLGAVTTWRPEWRGPGATDLTARLDPPVGPDLVLRGSRLRLSIEHLSILGTDGNPPEGLDLRLQAVVAAGQRWVTVPLGPLRNGTVESAKNRFPCTGGCRLVSISIQDPSIIIPIPYNANFDLTGIATDVQSSASLSAWTHDAHRWRNRIATSDDPEMGAPASVASDDPGLAVTMSDDVGNARPTLEPASGPPVLPAVAATTTSLSGFAGLHDVVTGADLGQGRLLLRVVGKAPVLPRSLKDGVLVDLSQMNRIADPSQSIAVDEVWLAPGRHPAVLARLAAEGVRVTSTSTLAEAIDVNEHRAPAEALRLSLVTAIVSALLTLLGLVAARVASLPGRLRDWRTLLRTGVSTDRLRWLVTLEATGPPAAGAVLGVFAALVAYLVTARRLPLAPLGVGNPPIDWAPSFAVLGLLAVAAVAVVLVVGFVSAVIEVRRAAR